MNVESVVRIVVLFITLVLHARAENPAQAPMTARQRNVIVFLCDDLGYGELNAYRKLYRYSPTSTDEPAKVAATPHLDSLASQGVICTRAYSHTWCAPARQSLLSGMWNNRISAYGQPWIGKHMKDFGLQTLMVGKNHGDLPARRILEWHGAKTEFDETFHVNLGEFTYYRNPDNRFKRESGDVLCQRVGSQPAKPYVPEGEEYITDLFAKRVVSFIDQKASANQGFFIYCAFNAPHSPLQGKPEDMRALFPKTFGSWTDEQIRQDGMKWQDSRYHREHIIAMVHAVDRAIGSVITSLKQHGLYDDTLIVVTSDNGGARSGKTIRSLNYPLSGAKHDSLDGGFRVPFIVRSGELAAAPRKPPFYDGLVSVCDILPTAIHHVDPARDLAQTATDGTDIMPYLMGAKAKLTGRRFFFQAKIPKDQSPTFKQPQDGYNSVLIEDDHKLQRVANDGSKPGKFHDVLKYLPDVTRDANPTIRLRENYDTDNTREPEKKSTMIRDLEALLSSSGNDLASEWSGNPSNKSLAGPFLHRYLKGADASQKSAR